jgi:hypothetical protein
VEKCTSIPKDSLEYLLNLTKNLRETNKHIKVFGVGGLFCFASALVLHALQIKIGTCSFSLICINLAVELEADYTL